MTPASDRPRSSAGPAGGTSAAAPAKINLSLHIVGRRADGYHLLESVVAFARIGDTVAAAPADGLSLDVDGPFAGALSGEADNLVLRAARLLAEAAGVPARARLTLTKRLPVASGIGGGSADAAAALRALTALWKAALPADDLQRVALQLGADVPVCLAGRPALMRGIGEIVDPLPALPTLPAVLVNPGLPLATPPVFKAYKASGAAFARADSDALYALARALAAPDPRAALVDRLARLGNDLTAAAIGLAPAVGRVLDRLAAAPGCRLARMSGSGGTCFGIFADEASAQSAAAALAQAEPRWWAVATQLGG